MEDDQIEQYNSDSGEEEFNLDGNDSDADPRGAQDGDNDGPQQNGWIQWICSLEGHEYMIAVEESYVRDYFNLFGLQTTLGKDKFKQCIKMILSPSQPSEEDLGDEQFLELNGEASDLYGLIHARYITSAIGMAKIYHKFQSGLYGHCPRALCDRQKVIPVGMSDNLKVSRFKVYCPRCEEVYIPKFKYVNIDGAFFGTSFPHQFLKHYSQAVILPPKIYHYEPQISGFKIMGKRGSKYFNPPKGNIRYNEDSMGGVEKEKILNEIKASNGRQNRFYGTGGAFSKEVQSLAQKLINQNFFVTETKSPDELIAEKIEEKSQADKQNDNNQQAQKGQGKKKGKGGKNKN